MAIGVEVNEAAVFFKGHDHIANLDESTPSGVTREVYKSNSRFGSHVESTRHASKEFQASPNVALRHNLTHKPLSDGENILSGAVVECRSISEQKLHMRAYIDKQRGFARDDPGCSSRT